jgi:hypothetical protein
LDKGEFPDKETIEEAIDYRVAFPSTVWERFSEEGRFEEYKTYIRKKYKICPCGCFLDIFCEDCNKEDASLHDIAFAFYYYKTVEEVKCYLKSKLSCTDQFDLLTEGEKKARTIENNKKFSESIDCLQKPRTLAKIFIAFFVVYAIFKIAILAEIFKIICILCILCGILDI